MLQEIGALNKYSSFNLYPLNTAIVSACTVNKSARIAVVFNPDILTHVRSLSIISGRVTLSIFQLVDSNVKFHVYNLYNFASDPAKIFSEIFPKIRESLQGESPEHVFIGGDFNVNLLISGARTSKILEFFVSLNLQEVSPSPLPTWRGNGERSASTSKLDAVFASLNGWELDLVPSPFSDHSVCHFTPPPPPPPAEERAPFQFSNTYILNNHDFARNTAETVADKIIQKHYSDKLNVAYPRYRPLFATEMKYYGVDHVANEVKSDPIDLFLSMLTELDKCIRKEIKARNKEYFTLKRKYKQIFNPKLADGRPLPPEAEQVKVSYREKYNEIHNHIQGIKRARKLANLCKSSANFFRSLNSNSSKNISRIEHPVTGELLLNDSEICDAFRIDFESKTSIPDVPVNSEPDMSCPALKRFCDKYNIDINSFFPYPVQRDVIDELKFDPVTLKDYINNLKNNSSPGNSGINKQVLIFAIKFFPYVTTNFFNKLISNTSWEKDERLSFLKFKNVIFIRKKNKDARITSSYRPISLLEVPYKIVSSRFAHILQPALEPNLSSDQFGFRANSIMSNASLTLISLIRALSDRGAQAPSVLAFLDLKAAFDTIKHDFMNHLTSILFPVGPFAVRYAQLAHAASAKVCVNSVRSQSCFMQIGSGQGDPSSSSRFLLGHLCWSSCIEFLMRPGNILQELGIPRSLVAASACDTGSDIVGPVSFADDTTIALRVPGSSEVFLAFYGVLDDLTSCSGLCLNKDKTEILLTRSENSYTQAQINVIKTLGQINPCVKHLGIYLSLNPDFACTKTFNEIRAKMESTGQKIGAIVPSSNIILKATAINSTIVSLWQHVLRVYSFCERDLTMIQGMVLDQTWTSSYKGETSKRNKISKHNVTKPVKCGGLGLADIRLVAAKAMISSILDAFKFAFDNPGSVLELTSNLSDSNLHIFNMNSRALPLVIRKLEKPFPGLAKQSDTLKRIFDGLETDQFAWGNAPTFMHSQTPKKSDPRFFFLPLCRKTFESEELRLQGQQFSTIASLCKRIIINRRVFFDIRYPSDRLNLNLPEHRFLDSIRINILKNSPTLATSGPTRIYRSSFSWLLGAMDSNKASLKKAFTRVFHDIDPSYTPPSYATGLADGCTLPRDPALFRSSYFWPANSSVPSSFRSVTIEFLNRTLISPRKLHRMGISSPPPHLSSYLTGGGS